MASTSPSEYVRLRSRSPIPERTPVPLLDLRRQHDPLLPEIQAAMDSVCQSGKFVLGPEVEQLEQSIANYCDARAAVGCASGSDALLLALLALGIGPGDEVIVPSFTFFASAGSIWQTGAMPVFVDIDPETCNIDAESVAGAITARTRAIMPVHLYGQCAEMEPLWRLAARFRLAIVEDAAQSLGAEYRGRRCGVLGDLACFSFYPTKNLGCFGDGGMVVANDPELAERVRLLRVHGMKPRYHHRLVGINSRLDSLQAAVLNVKLPHLDRWTHQRSENAKRYHELFRQAGLVGEIQLPHFAPDRRHVWNQYVIRVSGPGRRDALRAHLAASEIGTEIYYPIPVHRQECFANLQQAEKPLAQTSLACQEVLALPIFPELTGQEQQRVVDAISAFFAIEGRSRTTAQPNEKAA